MVTMPIGGKLTDRIGPGRVVLVGMVVVVLSVSGFAAILEADTSYWALGGALFVMGLGMGMTMMPTMAAAIQTLVHDEVPRASTMLNIIQQVSSSIGTAMISVLLANRLASELGGGAAVRSAAPRRCRRRSWRRSPGRWPTRSSTPTGTRRGCCSWPSCGAAAAAQEAGDHGRRRARADALSRLPASGRRREGPLRTSLARSTPRPDPWGTRPGFRLPGRSQDLAAAQYSSFSSRL